MNRDRVVELFTKLCRINSPSGEENEMAQFVTGFLMGLGLPVVKDDAGNLIATLPASEGYEGSPRIFFCAHLDTVEPNPNLNIKIEGGVIRTDGTSILGADDKAGVCAILEAIRIVVEKNIPHKQIQLLFTVGEEAGMVGARNLNHNLMDSDFGYVLDSDPPVGTIVFKTPTTYSMEVRIIGKEAHAGVEPERGVSAIQIAAYAIRDMRLGRIDAETTANIGSIHGGQVTNVVCPEVVLTAEARSLDREKVKEQVAHMKECFEQAAKNFGGKVNIKTNLSYEGYAHNWEEPCVRVIQAALKKLGWNNPEIREICGGSDANILNKMGLRSCVLGVAMQNIHTHKELVLIEDLVRSVELVLAIIESARDYEEGSHTSQGSQAGASTGSTTSARGQKSEEGQVSSQQSNRQP